MACFAQPLAAAGIRTWSIALACALTLAAGAGRAAEPTLLRVNAFPNAKALPLHAGIANGIFEQRGLKVELTLTPNSRSQRDGLAAGTFDVVHSAVDNALAMIEVGKHDVVIVTGGDSGMNEFFVQAEINSFADLRGRTLVVDAPDTAYALLAKKILAQHGLKDGKDYTVKPVGAGVFRLKAMAESKDNTAAILNLPFTVQAEELGMKSLGRTIDLLGPYQAERRLPDARLGARARGGAGALHRGLYRGAAVRARSHQPGAERRAADGEAQDRGQGGGAYLRPAHGSPASASPPTPSSTSPASTTCWRCARRSKAANRPRPSATSISAITSGRSHCWDGDRAAAAAPFWPRPIAVSGAAGRA